MIEITSAKSAAKWYFPNLNRIHLSFGFDDPSGEREKVWNNCIELIPLTRAKISSTN